MFDCCCVYVMAALVVLVFLVWQLFSSGMFDNVEVSVSDSPPMVNKPLTVYYKHHIGAYKSVAKLFKEVGELMPKGSTTFGIYYDDPYEVKEHLLQSVVGVVFGVDSKDLYSANYSEQLIRWGYERLTLPAVDKAVVATQKFEGYFSLITLVKFTYSKIMTYVKTHNHKIRFTMELYMDGKVHVVCPLDHQQEFLVHQLMTLEELETKLARRKWDSDVESESCSDTEPEEGAEGGDVNEEEPEDDEKDKKNE